MDNALRYATGKVSIDVRGRTSGAVSITISDDGPGISDTDLPHVFEPGYQGSATGGHQGAGLGMALAHRLINSAAGSIRAVSTNRGARIVVKLPGG